jgi:hypothetical protein
MKTWIIALCGAGVLLTSPAMAEHNSRARSESTLDLDVKIDHDGFRIGGRVLGEHVLGAWLNGRLTGDGFSVDGRVQGEERAYNFKMNAEVMDALRRAAARWWLLDL